MNYLHTNVHISEFSEKVLILTPIYGGRENVKNRSKRLLLISFWRELGGFLNGEKICIRQAVPFRKIYIMRGYCKLPYESK